MVPQLIMVFKLNENIKLVLYTENCENYNNAAKFTHPVQIKPS